MKLPLWIALGFLLLSFSESSDKAYIKSIKKHRKERRKEFKDPERSPLGERAKYFKQLYYFPIDPTYRVTAQLTKTPKAKPFRIPTNDPTVQKEFVSYGELSFELAGGTHTLTVYKSLQLLRIPLYKDYLFLPFRDESSGWDTYGGGRYLDLNIPEGSEMILDFNLAYNPNCAYSEGWSCPIPPAENTLSISVQAGEKNYPY